MIVWRVTVECSEGKSDVGGIDIYGGVSLTLEQVAERIGDIAYRIAHDLASELDEEGE